MRKIKFRGYSHEHEVWIYGDLLQYPDGEVYIMEHSDGESLSYRVEPESVDQSTGLKDKDDKEIYEGDIVRLPVSDSSVRHFVVEWANENRKLMSLDGFEHDGNPISISGWCFNWCGYRLYPSVIDGVLDTERMVVIGNIHDNPELIKQ